MRLLFLSLLLAITNQIQAQQIDFTDTTNQWFSRHVWTTAKQDYINNQITVYHYYYSGTKTKNNKEYLIAVGEWNRVTYTARPKSGWKNNTWDTSDIHKSNGIEQYYVRKGTTGNILITPTDDTSTKEDTLYNFQAQLGDPINAPVIGSAKVYKIDTVTINGSSQKRFRISVSGQQGYYDYTEGLGSHKDPFKLSEIKPNYIHTSAQLICFRNGQGYLYSNDIDLDCTGIFINSYLSVDDHAPTSKPITVYPQPAHERVNIELPNKTNGSITIYNTSGQTVYQSNFNNQQILNLQIDGATGIYFYLISDNKNGEQYRGKLSYY